jgi:hypothetical protein
VKYARGNDEKDGGELKCSRVIEYGLEAVKEGGDPQFCSTFVFMFSWV